MYVLTLSP